MEDNNIGLVLDKKSVILGDVKLEITDQIIAILNKELPSLKTN
jgi:Skp family chaperone for outer membrane proteins